MKRLLVIFTILISGIVSSQENDEFAFSCEVSDLDRYGFANQDTYRNSANIAPENAFFAIVDEYDSTNAIISAARQTAGGGIQYTVDIAYKGYTSYDSQYYHDSKLAPLKTSWAEYKLLIDFVRDTSDGINLGYDDFIVGITSTNRYASVKELDEGQSFTFVEDPIGTIRANDADGQELESWDKYTLTTPWWEARWSQINLWVLNPLK